MMNREIPDKGSGNKKSTFTAGTVAVLVAVTVMWASIASASESAEDGKFAGAADYELESHIQSMQSLVIAGNAIASIDTILNRVVRVNQMTTSAVVISPAKETVIVATLGNAQFLNPNLGVIPPVISADVNIIAAHALMDGSQLKPRFDAIASSAINTGANLEMGVDKTTARMVGTTNRCEPRGGSLSVMIG